MTKEEPPILFLPFSVFRQVPRNQQNPSGPPRKTWQRCIVVAHSSASCLVCLPMMSKSCTQIIHHTRQRICPQPAKRHFHCHRRPSPPITVAESWSFLRTGRDAASCRRPGARASATRRPARRRSRAACASAAPGGPCGSPFGIAPCCKKNEVSGRFLTTYRDGGSTYRGL